MSLFLKLQQLGLNLSYNGIDRDMDSCIDRFSCTDSKLAATTKQGIKAKIRTQLWDTCEDSGLSAFTITRGQF